jgi:hypothetical protein
MTERDSTEGAASPAAVRTPSRRSARGRVDPGDTRRQRLILAATFTAIAALIAVYFVFVAGRPPGGPVRELAALGAALDDRDLDTVLALWSRSPTDGPEPRDRVRALFEQLGAPGMTPRAEPPRVRTVDATTYRAIHRLGEIELESIWAWDGERYRLTALDLVR